MGKTEKEDKVNVHNCLLLKKVVDDGDGLAVVGTIIQHVFVVDDTEKKLEDIEFEYRFNDVSANGDEYVMKRRSEEHNTGLGTCYRHTYQVKIPLETRVKFEAFPFKVLSGSALIELSTFSTQDKSKQVRPNLMVHIEDKTNMVCIQRDLLEAVSDPNEDAKDNDGDEIFAKKLEEEAFTKIDRSKKYDFTKPFPHVQYFYDTKKKYCPKFMISFLLVEDGMKKFVEVVFPMFLIGVLNTINVLSDDEDEPIDVSDYIANSATFALAVIFLLPNVMGTSCVQKFFTSNNGFIITLFLALGLSSFPVAIAGTRYISYAGAGLYWASYVFPIYNWVKYILFFNEQKYPKCKRSYKYYMQVGKRERYNAKKSKSEEELISVSEAIECVENESDNKMKFNVKENDKFKILEYKYE